jgi:hypothetical protein
MKIRLPILTFFLLILIGCQQIINFQAKKEGAEGHFDRNWQWVNTPHKTLPTDEQWNNLQTQYNIVPREFIAAAETELDEEISSKDCYKYLYNSDSTRFLAFFIQKKRDPTYEKLTRFGQTVHLHNRASDTDSIEFYGYVLWGMNYNNNWYYHKDRENEFWSKNTKEAQLDFVHYILSRIDFFLNFRKNNEVFWENGGRTEVFKVLPNNNSYLEEFTGYPEIVGWHKVSKVGRQKQILNEQIEKMACKIEDDLWDTLHKSDSSTFHSRYKSKYSGKSCLVLYNSERNNILLPILYYDNHSNPWVTYFFVKINPEETSIYSWTKFPTKQITRESGSESLEIVYDIRNFIENWNWGTVNLISNEHFWTENFNGTDIEQIK